ncbi:MAG: protein kinase family protein [Proteobacteria bacterium]|nr:protein kinase family protein [Pseudomonadota bacterium]
MNNQLQDTQDSTRIITYSNIATELALLSDQCLTELVKNAMPIGTSIGGTSALLEISEKKVFIKKIRITDIERRPENIMSTRNIFELPLYYQYGIGSAGFGVWRELATHIMTTNWILSGECKNFPLMYHWRLLPRTILEAPTLEQLAELESDVEWWGGSSIIRARLMENLKASADIVVFLEYFPETLNKWLHQQILVGGDVAESASKMVDSNLNAITSFINSRGLLHFDAHFNNIMTDGHDLYFTDFGLAICSQFDLSEAELDFFKKNYNYDQCYTKAYFVEWLLKELFGAENWVIGNYNAMLHEYAAGKGRLLLPAIETIIRRYAPIAVIMNEFFIKLKKSKSTSYPTTELESIIL